MTRKSLKRLATLCLLLHVPAALPAQARPEHSLSLFGGMYAADGIGTNATFGGRYDYFILGGRYMIEASVSAGSLKSEVISSISKAQLFDSDNLLTYEFGFAYDYAPSGYVPFLFFGVAGVKQGDVTSFAFVLGLGKRIPLPGLFGTNAFGLRYDIRDQIFRQQMNNSDPFTAHNIAVTMGVQIYFGTTSL
jgi:hypothetical protein